MEGVLVIKNVPLKLIQLLQWREYWWSRTCLSNCFSFFNGGNIGDQERVCQILLLLQLEGVLVIKNVSVKLFSFFNGGSIGVQGRVCQIIRLHQWREYWWWRTCLSIASANFLEGVLVIKNWPVKLFSIFNGGIICDQKRVSQTLLFLQRRENW